MLQPQSKITEQQNNSEEKKQQQKQQQQIEVAKGKHLVQCGGCTFIIYEHYQILKCIGTGAYGVVVSANNKLTNQQVAIKQVSNAFADLIDAKRVLREIKLLMFFKHKNIIRLIDLIKPDSQDFNEIYLVFELMQSDLERLINSGHVLTDLHIKYFMVQILTGIHYIHSANVIHRDLKPNNLLVNKNCMLKIADLNLARKYENINHITEYVVTRWYRAPEILLSVSDYTKAIDIWSVGCIFAELLGRTPIFQGKHYLEQINCIIAILGTPSKEDIPYQVDEKVFQYIQTLPFREKVKWEELFPQANPLALDLLSHMLVFNPNKRFTAEECLNHAYFLGINFELETCKETFDWSFDNIDLKRELLQKAVYDESLKFSQVPIEQAAAYQLQQQQLAQIQLQQQQQQQAQQPIQGHQSQQPLQQQLGINKVVQDCKTPTQKSKQENGQQTQIQQQTEQISSYKLQENQKLKFMYQSNETIKKQIEQTNGDDHNNNTNINNHEKAKSDNVTQ